MSFQKDATLVEMDQLLIPYLGGTYRTFSLTNFYAGFSSSLKGRANFGLADSRVITQSGPYQHGSSPLAVYYDERPIDIRLGKRVGSRARLYDIRNEFIDLMRPTRAFNSSTFNPLIYRKWLPGGDKFGGSGGSIAANTSVFVANDGQFIHKGGLYAGKQIWIEGVGFVEITQVVNDYTLVTNVGTTGSDRTGLNWYYYRSQAIRDLNVITNSGLKFNDELTNRPYNPTGYNEIIQLVAHSPFWYGEEQQQSWSIDAGSPGNANLVFDGEGAYFGSDGRFLFGSDSVGEGAGGDSSVIYWGTHEAKPKFIITGPAERPSMTNQTTNITLQLLYNISAGEVVTIDVQALTVESTVAGNLSSYLTGPLSLFGLSPNVEDRVNEMLITFDGANENSNVQMTWRNLYAGI